MSAAIRSFTVFKDEPSSPPRSKSKSKSTDIAAEAAPAAIATAPPPPGPALVYAPDKENIDPITGERSMGEPNAPKKRKTTVLALKSQAPSKKLKDSSSKKATVGASSSSKPQKKARASTSRRAAKSGPSRARREPSLPRVAEEPEVQVDTQVLVDSRCYELTVLPLADVSKAYEQAPALEDLLKEVGGEETKVLESAPATPPPSQETSQGSPSRASSVFSTPDRKRIYSAFTFSSPSASGQRLAVSRASSVDRFSDIPF